MITAEEVQLCAAIRSRDDKLLFVFGADTRRWFLPLVPFVPGKDFTQSALEGFSRILDISFERPELAGIYANADTALFSKPTEIRLLVSFVLQPKGMVVEDEKKMWATRQNFPRGLTVFEKKVVEDVLAFSGAVVVD